MDVVILTPQKRLFDHKHAGRENREVRPTQQACGYAFSLIFTFKGRILMQPSTGKPYLLEPHVYFLTCNDRFFLTWRGFTFFRSWGRSTFCDLFNNANGKRKVRWWKMPCVGAPQHACVISCSNNCIRLPLKGIAADFCFCPFRNVSLQACLNLLNVTHHRRLLGHLTCFTAINKRDSFGSDPASRAQRPILFDRGCFSFWFFSIYLTRWKTHWDQDVCHTGDLALKYKI